MLIFTITRLLGNIKRDEIQTKDSALISINTPEFVLY